MVNEFLSGIAFSEGDLLSIKKAIESNTDRTFIFEIGDKPYFIKRMRPIRFPISAFLVNRFFEFFNVEFLKVSLKYGGNYSFQNEINFLTTFSQNHIPVPKLVHQDIDFLVLEALDGKSVDDQMSVNSKKLPLWSKVLEEILCLHQKGFYLSQGFSRNMVAANDRIFFIDFEENPLDYMDLDQAQAREWIFFLLSTIWRFNSLDSILPIWQKTISEENQAVNSYCRLVSRKFTWLRFLPKNRKIWGRDLIQLQALGRFFYHLKMYCKK
jgi:hypothetical protein